MTNQEIKNWQNFLLGFFISINNPRKILVDGMWGPQTENLTKEFQQRCNISQSGSLDKDTLTAALDYGYTINPEKFDIALPNNVERLSSAEREKIYGTFKYVPSPLQGNPESITVTDGWGSKNLLKINMPGMSHLVKNGAYFHKDIAEKVFTLFNEWNQKGLTQKIISWDGSYSPRFIRGSTTKLSNHAWGTAFDINALWNPLGSKPAFKGSKGSVIELVEIANKHGFFWGGHFSGRLDGMHFEIGKKI